ncbi:MAG TPA: STAS domain-containing protein [Terriglobia bacterium]|nr:STAS domain-containing protein [Terriglobia bacterium]
MLKITYNDTPESTSVKLEGKLSGPWVEELERSWIEHSSKASENVIIDLSGVTYIDPEGKRLLSRMVEKGVCLEGTHLMTKYVIDEITRAGVRPGRIGG